MNYFIKKLKVFDFFNKKCYNMSTFCDYYQKVKKILKNVFSYDKLLQVESNNSNTLKYKI